ncbi:hypothetical protein CK203_066008 [Vitis vinifera]|uniref:Uncharacterized protein n=1 Tax=Vitis vinifera TaxID=29760 RepID=A0A438G2E7_VITVI|nr:hypothetical protein CK203_113863 [Vitis vinifera]RVW66375.1 hypothetical protein CK203_066008 [Vitis vinifera]
MACSHPFEEATHTKSVEHRPEPFTPFLTWCGLEEVVPTFRCLASQAKSLLSMRFDISGPRGPTIPSSEGGVPSNPPQCRYEKRRPPTTLRPNPRAPSILNVLLACHRKPSSNDLWSPHRPLREIQIVKPDHSIPSYILTLREFFYPRVAMDFYQSMTTHSAQSPAAIHFSIDGLQGILEARHVAKALHIP